MIEKISRNRVNGFLKAEERRIVNSKGEEFLPLGVAFGNWLLCEGNMWAFGEGNPYDRPRRFETLIRDLCGSAYATGFWKRFRDNFITEADVEAIADIGFNSVRIPINWRVLMEDEPGIAFIEEGFQLIDRCIDWCEKYHLYVFLDLHGRPADRRARTLTILLTISRDCLWMRIVMKNAWRCGVKLPGDIVTAGLSAVMTCSMNRLIMHCQICRTGRRAWLHFMKIAFV